MHLVIIHTSIEYIWFQLETYSYLFNTSLIDISTVYRRESGVRAFKIVRCNFR